ncbi:hypothetical protein DM02DRAFT_670078 [Periconia macrospinosa]|uniref:Uncharacterized protein n=1 Tax=Periconia macrospinosa TaxID=97972 RepID=A0A2V1E0Y5_9PLEO|nr:hypothetical protein DM02DRAFT_670078 [Periconia macrospinosa]
MTMEGNELSDQIRECVQKNDNNPPPLHDGINDHSSTAAGTEPQCHKLHFFDLPMELRLKCYNFLPVKTKHVKIQIHPTMKNIVGKPEHITLILKSIPGLPILATCRSINQEARIVLQPKLDAIASGVPCMILTGNLINGFSDRREIRQVDQCLTIKTTIVKRILSAMELEPSDLDIDDIFQEIAPRPGRFQTYSTLLPCSVPPTVRRGTDQFIKQSLLYYQRISTNSSDDHVKKSASFRRASVECPLKARIALDFTTYFPSVNQNIAYRERWLFTGHRHLLRDATNHELLWIDPELFVEDGSGLRDWNDIRQYIALNMLFFRNFVNLMRGSSYFEGHIAMVDQAAWREEWAETETL